MSPEVPYVISYNGQSPWGTGYNDGAPYVSVDYENVLYANKIGNIRTVTLIGSIASGGVDKIALIKNAFTGNFKAFSAPNIYMPSAMIQSISFSPQKYFGKVDYSIALKDFSGFLYNVINPIDEVSFSQDQDGSVTINHKISAIGLSTSDSNAYSSLANAKSFVLNRTGMSNTISRVGTNYIPITNSGNTILISLQENINRANQEYSIIEIYKYDPIRNSQSGTFKRFSVDFTSGYQDDYIQASIAGTFSMGKDIWNTGIFAQTSSGEIYNIAASILPGLNSNPISFNIDTEETTQSLYGRSLSIKANYDNSPNFSWFDYDFSADKDLKTNITQISVKGQIVGSGRHARKKMQNCLSFYNSVMGGNNGMTAYLYNACLSGANDFGYTNYSFNPIPRNITYSINSGAGYIGLSATFDDAPFVSGYVDYNWSTSVDCGLNIFKPLQSINKNGLYVIQDTNIINRSKIGIDGNFSIPIINNTLDYSNLSCNYIPNLIKNIEGLQNASLDSQSYSYETGESVKTGFHIQYSKESSNLTSIPMDGKIYQGSVI